jgi:hypothetical protein
MNTLRREVEEERALSSEQREELARIQQDTKEMQSRIMVAQETLDQQQEKLSDLSLLLKSVYTATRTNAVDTSTDSKRFVALATETGVSAYVLLPESPIQESLSLQYHVFSQPPGSYWLYGKNLVLFAWGESESNLRTKPLYLRFVPDPKPMAMYSALERRGDRIFVDGKPLPYANLRDDPWMERSLAEKSAAGAVDPVDAISWEEFDRVLEMHGAERMNRIPATGSP